MIIRGMGVDLVEVDRIRRIIERRPRFVERVFTEREIGQARELAEPWQYYASRFAVKEAVIKALGRPLAFRHIEALAVEGGAPALSVVVDSAEIGSRFMVSLSHTRGCAVAQALHFHDPEGEI